MLIPIPYSPDLTSLPKVSTIQEYTNRRENWAQTYVETKRETRTQESTLTEVKPLNAEGEKNDVKLTSSYTSGNNEISEPTEEFSESYVEYNTKSLITKLIKEFTLWESLGTDDGLIHISNIQDILESYEPYLTQDAKNRILLSTLQLIVRNNNWEKVTGGQLKQLTLELKRFNEGNINWDNLDTFAKQLYRRKIKII